MKYRMAARCGYRRRTRAGGRNKMYQVVSAQQNVVFMLSNDSAALSSLGFAYHKALAIKGLRLISFYGSVAEC